MNIFLINVFDEIQRANFDDWREILLIVKANKGFASYKGSLFDLNGNKKGLNIRLLSSEFSDNFIHLYEDKTSNNGGKWNELEIRISPIEILSVKYSFNQEKQNRVDAYNKRFEE